MLYFVNPGELDPRFAQLFGVNVKESESPIGHFGTGLKYAIAVTLRLNGKITLYSGTTRHIFHTSKETLRGKTFDLVRMGETQLPFTLELGKCWEPWMAYRELWSNAQDEGGFTTTSPQTPSPQTTLIEVDCKELEAAHESRHTFLLQSSPIQTISNQLEIHRGPSKTLFYRGVKVHEFTKPGCYTYNLLAQTELTEDRTLRDVWTTTRKIIRAMAEEASPEKLGHLLLAGEGLWEWEADWDLWFGEKPANFETVLANLAKHHRAKLPRSILTNPSHLPPLPATLTQVEQKMLTKAKNFLSKLNFHISEEVEVVESLGSGILGSVRDGKIVLCKEAFRQGTKRLAGTILEEHFHITLKVRDGSLEMQNLLLDTIMSLGEQVVGEPI